MFTFRRALMMRPLGGSLPAGYTRYDYITKPVYNSLAHIDTGVRNLPDYNLLFEIKTTVQSATSTRLIFGDSGGGWLRVMDFRTTRSLRWVATRTSYYFFNLPEDYFGVPYIITCDNAFLSVNGEEGTYSIDSGNSSYNSTITLLHGRGNRGWDGKVYYFKIWKEGELIRNFIPCTNPDGVVGMYDLVGHQFYSNAGSSGELTVGND